MIRNSFPQILSDFNLRKSDASRKFEVQNCLSLTEKNSDQLSVIKDEISHALTETITKYIEKDYVFHKQDFNLSDGTPLVISLTVNVGATVELAGTKVIICTHIYDLVIALNQLCGNFCQKETYTSADNSKPSESAVKPKPDNLIKILNVYEKLSLGYMPHEIDTIIREFRVKHNSEKSNFLRMNGYSVSLDKDLNLVILSTKLTTTAQSNGVDSTVKFGSFLIKNWQSDNYTVFHYIQKKPNKQKTQFATEIYNSYQHDGLQKVSKITKSSQIKDAYIDMHKGVTLKNLLEVPWSDEEKVKIFTAIFSAYTELALKLIERDGVIFDAHNENILLAKLPNGNYRAQIVDYQSRLADVTNETLCNALVFKTFRNGWLLPHRVSEDQKDLKSKFILYKSWAQVSWFYFLKNFPENSIISSKMGDTNYQLGGPNSDTLKFLKDVVTPQQFREFLTNAQLTTI